MVNNGRERAGGHFEDTDLQLYNVHRGILSILYNDAEQVMLDMIRKDKTGETWDGHIAKFSNTSRWGVVEDGANLELVNGS